MASNHGFQLEGSLHVFIVVLCSLLFLTTPANIRADVYADFSNPLVHNTHSLVDILSLAAQPGGTRSVSINGNRLLVKRYVNPAGDDEAFFGIWQDIQSERVNVNANILSPLLEKDPILQSLAGGTPFMALEEREVDVLFETAENFAINQSRQIRSLVIDAIESPFAYETERFRAIASVPIWSIDPTSSLVESSKKTGQLFLAEKLPGSKVSKAFWHMQFGVDFNITKLFDGSEGNSKAPPLDPFPGSRRTLAFEENTAGWRSNSWSYESQGDVLTQVSHYLQQFDALGFTKENRVLIDSDYALLQFSKLNQKATLFVELLDPRTQDIQITLHIQE